MHRSMKESELTHKTTNAAFESKIRTKEASHAQATSQVHALEKATVPDNEVSSHPAIKHSVGHYIERSSKNVSSMRRHRG
jgi:hypothetical protein